MAIAVLITFRIILITFLVVVDFFGPLHEKKDISRFRKKNDDLLVTKFVYKAQ